MVFSFSCVKLYMYILQSFLVHHALILYAAGIDPVSLSLDEMVV